MVVVTVETVDVTRRFKAAAGLLFPDLHICRESRNCFDHMTFSFFSCFVCKTGVEVEFLSFPVNYFNI